MPPGIRVCESQSQYRFSKAQWVERWNGTPKALSPS